MTADDFTASRQPGRYPFGADAAMTAKALRTLADDLEQRAVTLAAVTFVVTNRTEAFQMRTLILRFAERTRGAIPLEELPSAAGTGGT